MAWAALQNTLKTAYTRRWLQSQRSKASPRGNHLLGHPRAERHVDLERHPNGNLLWLRVMNAISTVKYPRPPANFREKAIWHPFLGSRNFKRLPPPLLLIFGGTRGVEDRDPFRSPPRLELEAAGAKDLNSARASHMVTWNERPPARHAVCISAPGNLMRTKANI